MRDEFVRKELRKKHTKDLAVDARAKAPYSERMVKVIKPRTLAQVLKDLKRYGGMK